MDCSKSHVSWRWGVRQNITAPSSECLTSAFTLRHQGFRGRCVNAIKSRAAIEPEVLEPQRGRAPPPPPPPARQSNSTDGSSRRTLLGAAGGAVLLGTLGFNAVFNQPRDDRSPYTRESPEDQTAFQQPPRNPNRDEIAAVLTSPNGAAKYLVRKLPTPSQHIFLQDRQRCYILTMPFLVDTSDEAAVKRAVARHLKTGEGQAEVVGSDYYEWLLTKEAPSTTRAWVETELAQKFADAVWED